ncbi:SMP-30/gluconolactonase/LRE family protein [Actinopolymorpha alba]|uniref:SMP-30/gluconolactonase/LRE family protein n=1 Tax=Actinopolymorpha alba TaxID=533267 RepID=UPI00035FBC09|nr:hypothetical protein [Actinopolymorpha alba]
MVNRTGLGAAVLMTLLGTAAALVPPGPGATAPQAYADANAPRDLPKTYVVSNEAGVLPEGIAVHSDGTMYVTSKASGTLYRGRVGASHLTPFPVKGVTGEGERRTSLGVHTDRAGNIFSVGGDTLTVHNRAGRLLDSTQAAGGPLGAANLNDLAITPTAVYVTDWANPIIYRAERRGATIGPLRPWLDIRPAIPGFPAQYWLLNGIVANADGSTVLVASNGTEAVWRVDAATKAVTEVDLGGQSFGADGMVLNGRNLYAVLNYGAPHGIYVARLDQDLRRGEVVHTILTDADGQAFDLPTTLARHGCRLYVVNSQLDQEPSTPPYTVSAVPDPVCPAR